MQALGLTPVRAGDPSLPPIVAARQRSFVIPFRVAPPPPGLKELPQVDLHVSTDQGRTWQVRVSAKVNEHGFRFRADEDGEYWFAVRPRPKTKAAPSPADRAAIQPELRVLVDTIPPELELSAQCDEHGAITARLKIVEEHLQNDSVKLEYRGADGIEAWEPVALDPIPADVPGPTFYGQPIWKPERSNRAYSIRAEVRDLAGNPAVAEAQVQWEEPQIDGPALQLDRQTRTAPPATEFASNTRTVTPLPPVERHFGPPPGSGATDWPADESGDIPVESGHRLDGLSSVSRLPPVDEPGDVGGRWQTARSANSGVSSPGRSAAEVHPPVANRFDGQRTAESGQDWLPPGVHPRMVNATKFQLDYDVESVGPWGIRRVELWGTRDYGRTWKQYGVDDDNQSPLLATVESEGVYGFRVLVQSGSGLVETPPQSGDVPEIWIRVDLTQPTCKITGIDHGSGERAGQLIIHWDAYDAQPGERPISLAFSDNPNGPWQPIASGLRNTGRYVWQLDQRTPNAVYLRLEFRDGAGNVAVYQPAEPVTVAPLRPRARIREVRPFDATRP